MQTYVKHIVLGLAAVLVFSACTSPMDESSNENANTNTAPAATTEEQMDAALPANDDAAISVSEAEMEKIKSVEYMYKGDLSPVDGGNGSGAAMATFENDEYLMRAEINNIPDPEEGFFYEGWVVRPEPFNFISTGELKKEGDTWVNDYMSETDFTDHFRYVLTIEPDDNDPAPADHVVEGDMMKK